MNNWQKQLEEVGRELGVNHLEDWYTVSRHEVCNKLRFISKQYRNNLLSALKDIYPHFNWDSSRFKHVIHGHWTDLNNQRNQLEQIGKQLGVKELDDWS